MRKLLFFLSCMFFGCQAQLDETNRHDDKYNHRHSPPAVSGYMKSPAVLIFTETRDWRHEEGIAGGNLFFIRAARDMGLGYFTTEDSAIFRNDLLDKFDLIIFNNVTGLALEPWEQNALQNWIRKGGGLLAIHGSGDSSHSYWPWYADDVIGPKFISHPMDPQIQGASIDVLAKTHPIMEGVPLRFSHADEWYTFDSVPSADFKVLAGLDESTYSPVNNVYGDVSDLRMGLGAENHPIMWTRCHEKGRTFYSAMGHTDHAFEAEHHQKILKNAMKWLRKETDRSGVLGCKPN